MARFDKLPKEIQEKMLEMQVEQGNKRNANVFRGDIRTGCTRGGFRWAGTKEGCTFWDEVISNKNYTLFFERYPKTAENEYPKVMLVSDTKRCWVKRVVFMEKNGYFLAWSGAETLEDSESETETIEWKYAKDLPKTTKLTIQEIADKFNIDVECLEIVK